jgi:hypothetical protein
MDIWTGEQRRATLTDLQPGRESAVKSPFTGRSAVAHFRKQ